MGPLALRGILDGKRHSRSEIFHNFCLPAACGGAALGAKIPLLFFFSSSCRLPKAYLLYYCALPWQQYRTCANKGGPLKVSHTLGSLIKIALTRCVLCQISKSGTYHRAGTKKMFLNRICFFIRVDTVYELSLIDQGVIFSTLDTHFTCHFSGFFQ